MPTFSYLYFIRFLWIDVCVHTIVPASIIHTTHCLSDVCGCCTCVNINTGIMAQGTLKFNRTLHYTYHKNDTEHDTDNASIDEKHFISIRRLVSLAYRYMINEYRACRRFAHTRSLPACTAIGIKLNAAVDTYQACCLTSSIEGMYCRECGIVRKRGRCVRSFMVSITLLEVWAELPVFTVLNELNLF